MMQQQQSQDAGCPDFWDEVTSQLERDSTDESLVVDGRGQDRWPTRTHIQLFSSALHRNVSLGLLRLTSCGLEASDLIHIGRALGDNIRLFTLDLSSNHVGPRGLKNLAAGLERNESLLRLTLNDVEATGGSNTHQVDTSGIDALCQALAVGGSVTTLELESNCLTDHGEHSEPLLSILQLLNHGTNKTNGQLGGKRSSVTTLNLCSNDLCDTDAQLLVDHLVDNDTLSCLRVGNNPLGPMGAAQFARLFRDSSTSTLRELEASNCDLSDGGRDMSGLLDIADALWLPPPVRTHIAIEDTWQLVFGILDGTLHFDNDQDQAPSRRSKESQSLSDSDSDSESETEQDWVELDESKTRQSILARERQTAFDGMSSGKRRPRKRQGARLTSLDLRDNNLDRDCVRELAGAARANWHLQSVKTQNSQRVRQDTREASRSLAPEGTADGANDEESSVVLEGMRISLENRTRANQSMAKLLAHMLAKDWAQVATACSHRQRSPLHECVQAGATVAAARLVAQVQKCKSSNNKSEVTAAQLVLDHIDEMRRTALYLAVQAQDGILTGALLACGADPNKTDQYGASPLHIACAQGHGGDLALACLLVEHGASLSLKDVRGVLPLERSPLPWFRNEIIRRSTRADLVVMCRGSPHEEQSAHELIYLLSQEDSSVTTRVQRLDDFFSTTGLTHDILRVAAFQQDDPWQLTKGWSLNHTQQPRAKQKVVVVEKQERLDAASRLAQANRGNNEDVHGEAVVSDADASDEVKDNAAPYAGTTLVDQIEKVWTSLRDTTAVVVVVGQSALSSKHTHVVLEQIRERQRAEQEVRAEALQSWIGYSKLTKRSSGSSGSTSYKKRGSGLYCAMLESDTAADNDELEELLDEKIPTIDVEELKEMCFRADIMPSPELNNTIRTLCEQVRARKEDMSGSRRLALTRLAGMDGDLFALDCLVQSQQAFVMVVAGFGNESVSEGTSRKNKHNNHKTPRASVEAVTRFVQVELSKSHVPCWVESHFRHSRYEDPAALAEYRASILNAIGASRRVIVVLSQHNSSSHILQRYVQEARDQGVPIQTVVTSQFPIPPTFADLLSGSSSVNFHLSGNDLSSLPTSSLSAKRGAMQGILFGENVRSLVLENGPACWALPRGMDNTLLGGIGGGGHRVAQGKESERTQGEGERRGRGGLNADRRLHATQVAVSALPGEQALRIRQLEQALRKSQAQEKLYRSVALDCFRAQERMYQQLKQRAEHDAKLAQVRDKLGPAEKRRRTKVNDLKQRLAALISAQMTAAESTKGLVAAPRVKKMEVDEHKLRMQIDECQRELAALTIQRIFRGMTGRRDASRKRRLRATLRIQRKWRRYQKGWRF